MVHTFGLPYKGSKSRFCKEIFESFPSAQNFVDVFGGGGAMTHYAMLHGLFKFHYYNDINPSITRLFLDAIRGDIPQLKWVSRSTFKQLRFYDMFSSLLFSFGGNCMDYFVSKEKEREKEGIFNAVMYKDYSFCPTIAKDILLNYEQSSWSERYQAIQIDRQRTYAVEPFHRYRRMLKLRLPSILLTSLNVTSLDYRQLQIPDNSIVYCDIPYDTKNRNYPSGKGALISFDYSDFYDWACFLNRRHHVHVFVSSTSLPNDRFKVLASFNQRCTYSATGNSKKILEHLYIPR